MEKLTKSSKLFHEIIYIIWQVVSYYADYFGYDAPESAHELSLELLKDRTLIKIRVYVPRIGEFEEPCSSEDMRATMNEYLSLLLRSSSIPPFAGGDSCYELVEPLFITTITTDGSWYDFDFLWVDNMDAYRKVKENRMGNIIEII